MNASVDPTRLYTTLTNTGLRQKDPILYQLLYNLIGTLAKLKSTVDDDNSGSGGSTDTTTVTQIIQQLSLGDDSGGGGDDGPPGQRGIDGAQGIQGPMGPMGAIIFPPDAEDGDIHPAQIGPQGNPGITGPQGPAGPPGLPSEDGLEGDSFRIPGIPGPQGGTGLPGATGSPVYFEDGLDGEPGLFVVQPAPVPPSVYAYVYRSTAQTITDNTLTAITFDNAPVDASVFWSSGSPTKLTVPTGKDGTYIILGQVEWVIFGATGFVSVGIYKNGTLIAEQEVNVTGITPTIQVGVQENLIATDFIELKVLADSSGASYDTVGGARSVFLQLIKAAAVTGGSGGGGSSNFTAATVTTSQTQASNTAYGDLATVGPAVTLVLTGTIAIIWISAGAVKGSAGNSCMIAPAVSGASTVAAANGNAAIVSASSASHDNTLARVLVLTGLTPGSNTFTIKYQNNGGGVWTFQNRSIAVYAP